MKEEIISKPTNKKFRSNYDQINWGRKKGSHETLTIKSLKRARDLIMNENHGEASYLSEEDITSIIVANGGLENTKRLLGIKK